LLAAEGRFDGACRNDEIGIRMTKLAAGPLRLQHLEVRILPSQPHSRAILAVWVTPRKPQESTNRRVDVIAEGFDVAIRVRFPPVEPTDLVMRRLDESIQCLVASPALIRTPLSSPSDLSGLPSLDPGPVHDDHQWHLDHKDGQTALVPLRPHLITDDIAVLREAALAGVGVVQLPTVVIWDDIRAGRLVHVLPQWQPRSGMVHAVFPSRRGLLPSVRVLVDFLARECAQSETRSWRPQLRGGVNGHRIQN
jgi:DNA-binding transcriptional LysR family regulator